MSQATLYSVSVCITKMPWPLSLGVHAWFVLSDGTTDNRIEVWAPIWVKGDNTVILNAMEPFAGFRRYYFDSPTSPKWTFPTETLAKVEGVYGSHAHKLYEIILQSSSTYPYKHTYRMIPGPNSNTYVAWALQQVPEIGLSLPWRAFGRNFPLPQK